MAAYPIGMLPIASHSRYASAQKQIVVGRVDDGVCVHFRQVALLDDDSLGE